MMSCLVVALSTLTVACTGTTPGGSPAAKTPPAAVSTASPASDSTSAVTTSPYSLTIPKPRKGAVAYSWHAGDKNRTAVLGDVVPHTDYTVRGACIYGIGDTNRYQLLNAGADAASARQPRVLGSGSIDCDGAVHSKTFRIPFRQVVQVQLGPVGDKTKAYVELDRH